MCCTEKLSMVGVLLPSLGQHLPSPPIGMLPRFSMFPKTGCPCLFSPPPCSWPLDVPDGRDLKDWAGRSVGRSKRPGVAPCADGSAPASGPPASAQPHDCFIHCPIQLGEKRVGLRCPPELLAFLPGRIAIADPDSQRPPRPSHTVCMARPARLLPCYLSDRIPGSIWNGLGKGGRTGTGVPRRGCVCKDGCDWIAGMSLSGPVRLPT